ncbi:MAG TPA: serine hydrolase [Candidatus Dormibacteraeota bacterium]|nr:serine hydrolase [Candidatus Dormibacteraeota bacterium]
MRGRGRSIVHSAIYPLVLALLPLLSSAAYPGSDLGADGVAASSPDRGTATTIARLNPPVTAAEVSTKPLQPITTVLSPTLVDQLRADLATIGAPSGAQIEVDLEELSGPRRTSLSINGNQSFYAASAYKLPLLMAEAQAIATGQASPSDVLCYDPSDQEDGWFTDYGIGTCFSRQDLAVRAGRYSDNTAAHILVRYLGGPDALNAYARSASMTSSALWDPNTTTVTDLAAAWVNEVLGRLGGGGAQQWLYPILTHTAFEQGIPAGLPGGVTVVHKVGDIYGVENDSAYVTNGHIFYVLTVAVEGPDEATGWLVIAQVSQRIWRYETGRPDYVVAVSATPAPAVWPDRRH